MTAGVVLSRLIATRQKLKFVLGRVIAAFPKYAKVFLLASNVRFGIWNVGIRDVNLSLLSLSFYFRPLWCWWQPNFGRDRVCRICDSLYLWPRGRFWPASQRWHYAIDEEHPATWFRLKIHWHLYIQCIPVLIQVLRLLWVPNTINASCTHCLMPHPAVLDLLQFDIIWRLLISLPQLAYGSLQWRYRGCQTVLSKQGRWYSDFTIDWVKLRPVDWRSCAEQALLTVRPLQKQLESRLQARDAGKIAAIAQDWEIVLACTPSCGSQSVSMKCAS